MVDLYSVSVARSQQGINATLRQYFLNDKCLILWLALSYMAVAALSSSLSWVPKRVHGHQSLQLVMVYIFMAAFELIGLKHSLSVTVSLISRRCILGNEPKTNLYQYKLTIVSLSTNLNENEQFGLVLVKTSVLELKTRSLNPSTL